MSCLLISELLQDNQTNAVRINPRLKSPVSWLPVDCIIHGPTMSHILVTPKSYAKSDPAWIVNHCIWKLCRPQRSSKRKGRFQSSIPVSGEQQTQHKCSFGSPSWCSAHCFAIMQSHRWKTVLILSNASLVWIQKSLVLACNMRFSPCKNIEILYYIHIRTEGISNDFAATTLVPSAKVLSRQRLESQDHKGLGQSTTASSHTENQWFRKDELNTYLTPIESTIDHSSVAAVSIGTLQAKPDCSGTLIMIYQFELSRSRSCFNSQ